MSTHLREHYLAYLDALNERRLDDLVDFVADELTYNGRSMTRVEYQDLRRDDVRAIPDLVFVVDLLVVEADRVACRITFDCTPESSFLGFPAPGGRVQFAEHVFYRFEDDRIVEVVSLIDRDAIRQQVSASAASDHE